MPYITSVERIAEARGEARGEAKGGASVLLKQVAQIGGFVPDEIDRRIRELALEQLEAMGAAMLRFHSLDDVEAWLDENV